MKQKKIAIQIKFDFLKEFFSLFACNCSAVSYKKINSSIKPAITGEVNGDVMLFVCFLYFEFFFPETFPLVMHLCHSRCITASR